MKRLADMTLCRVTVEHLALAGQPGGPPRRPDKVVRVEVVRDRGLCVTFADRLSGRLRFQPALFRGVFAHLTNPWFFAEVGIQGGALTWPGKLDFCPDSMYKDVIGDDGEHVYR